MSRDACLLLLAQLLSSSTYPVSLLVPPQVVRLPKGATAVDFAYHIHTEVRAALCAAAPAWHYYLLRACPGTLKLVCGLQYLVANSLNPTLTQPNCSLPLLPRWATPWWAPRSTASWCRLRGSCRTRVGPGLGGGCVHFGLPPRRKGIGKLLSA